MGHHGNEGQAHCSRAQAPHQTGPQRPVSRRRPPAKYYTQLPSSALCCPRSVTSSPPLSPLLLFIPPAYIPSFVSSSSDGFRDWASLHRPRPPPHTTRFTNTHPAWSLSDPLSIRLVRPSAFSSTGGNSPFLRASLSFRTSLVLSSSILISHYFYFASRPRVRQHIRFRSSITFVAFPRLAWDTIRQATPQPRHCSDSTRFRPPSVFAPSRVSERRSNIWSASVLNLSRR